MCGCAGHEDGPSDGSSAGACCRAELGSRWPSEPCKASIALVRCKRAALATKNSNPEAAMEWVLQHMEDADFNEPLPPPEAAQPGLSCIA